MARRAIHYNIESFKRSARKGLRALPTSFSAALFFPLRNLRINFPAVLAVNPDFSICKNSVILSE
ncbi:MAG: hypothetical protein WC959_09845 [Kiritimatiellales bacterium]